MIWLCACRGLVYVCPLLYVCTIFNAIKLSSIYLSLITVFHDISTQIQQRALIGKIFARWHLAIAITSNIARSKYNHVMCILCSINHQSKIIFYWYQSYH